MRFIGCLLLVLTAAAEGPEIIVAPDQPVPCVYLDDPLILSLKVPEPADVRVSVSLVDDGGQAWDMDLGDLRLPPGVERWYALKGAPAERGFYAVTVTVAVNGGSFTKKVGLCRVDRPTKISRSVLGISVAAGAWPAGLEHALKTVGARSVRVSLSNADLRQAEAGLARVGLKAWLDLSDEAAAALTAESGRLRVSDTWVGIQLPAASTALFQKIRDKSDLPLWAVADSVEDALGSINGPAAPLASGMVLRLPAPPLPEERARLAWTTLPVAVDLTDAAWIADRPTDALLWDILEMMAAGVSSVHLPAAAVYAPQTGFTPAAALFNVFGALFSGVDYVGRLNLAEGVSALLFRNQADWVLVFWRPGQSGDPVPVTLPLEGAVSVAVMDHFGNALPDTGNPVEGNLNLQLAGTPLIVRGTGGNILARAAASRAEEIISAMLSMPEPAGSLLSGDTRALLESVRKSPAGEGARARYIDLLRQISRFETAVAVGEVDPVSAGVLSRGFLSLARALAVVEEGRGELFLEPVTDMIAETERMQTMYLTATQPGAQGGAVKAEQVLNDLKKLVQNAENLAAAGRKIEAAALASLAQHYAKCLEIYARGTSAAAVTRLDGRSGTPVPPQPVSAQAAAPAQQTQKDDQESAPDSAKATTASGRALQEPSKETQPGSTPSAEGEIVHIVAKGENPSVIANKYGVSLDDLLKWNRMTPKSRINIGDKILIRKGKTAPEPEKVRQEPDKESPTEPADSPGEEIIHVVAKGENPYMIAKKYGVSLDDLLKWNNMTSKSRINIGDKIIIRKGKR